METTQFELDTEYIQLNQLLKVMNLTMSGGESKIVIKEGLVKVNKQVVSEIRKKIYKTDIVEFDNTSIHII